MTTGPKTEAPEKGQGPWCSPNFDNWWVVAETASEALAAIEGVDAHVFPSYFGWHAEVKRVCIRWCWPSGEETEIEECMSNDPGAVEAWRIRVMNA